MSMSTFQSIKHDIVTFASLSKDALHIYVGLLVFLLAAAVVRKGMRSALPLLLVLLVALAGEVLDTLDGGWNFRASLRDFVNTAFWPVMLWLLARYTRVMN